MLLLGIVAGLPIVEEQSTERADDIVGFVGRGGMVEKPGAGEGLWRGFLVVDLPLSGPLQEGGEAVVVLEELIHVGGTRWDLARQWWRRSVEWMWKG